MKILLLLTILTICHCYHVPKTSDIKYHHQSVINNINPNSIKTLQGDNEVIKNYVIPTTEAPNSTVKPKKDCDAKKTKMDNFVGVVTAFVSGGMAFAACMMTAFTAGFFAGKWKFRKNSSKSGENPQKIATKKPRKELPEMKNDIDNAIEATGPTGIQIDAAIEAIDGTDAIKEALKNVEIYTDSNPLSKTLIGQGKFRQTLKAIIQLKDNSIKHVAIYNVRKYYKDSYLIIAHYHCLKNLKHPNILQSFGIYVSNKIISGYVMEFMALGDVLTFIKGPGRDVSSKTMYHWFSQIAQAMVFLKDHGINHGNLKAKNILMDNHEKVKIGHLDTLGQENLKVLDDNIRWKAIEVITDGNNIDEYSDVWSYGVTLWEISTYGSSKPYANIETQFLGQMLEAGLRLFKPLKASDGLYELLCDCWKAEPKERPKFVDIRDNLEILLLNLSFSRF